MPSATLSRTSVRGLGSPGVQGPNPEAYRRIIARCDSTRLPWGSDFGCGPTDPIPYRLGMMDMLGLSDAQRAPILDANPRRVLGFTAG